MVKRLLTLLLASGLVSGFSACRKPTPAQNAAVAQKAFQDKQRLVLIKVYDDLVKKYPNLPDAEKSAKAQERARILREQAGLLKPTPAKK